MIITPAILAKDAHDFRQYFSYAHQLPSGRWHVDILDGSLHGAPCWHDANVVGDIPDLPDLELHLMVRDPLFHILAWHRAVPSLRRVLLDADLFDLSKILRQARALRLDISLVLNPGVPPDICAAFIDTLDEIVVMGVSPGSSGQTFLGEAVLSTIRRTRALFPLIDIAVDGGVQLHTIPALARSGVSRSITSSALWKSPDPLDAHLALQEASKIVL